MNEVLNLLLLVKMCIFIFYKKKNKKYKINANEDDYLQT